MSVGLRLLFLCCFTLVLGAFAVPCIPEDGVCICNASYCDTVKGLPPMDNDTFAVYVTSKAGSRLSLTTHKMEPSASRADRTVDISINTANTYQTIVGFGGAMTDAAAINIKSMSLVLQELLLHGYYGSDGLSYSLGRTNIGGCDFSPRVYTYDDVVGDLELKNFSLQPEDLQYKIPLMARANEISSQGITWFASPWSAPGWMKTTNKTGHGGSLLGKAGDAVHKAWAQYLVKFLEYYKAAGIDFWGMTAQNEPTDGTFPKFEFNAMRFTPETQRDFIKSDLGPLLQSKFPEVKLMICDDQRDTLHKWTDVVYNDPDAKKYVAGAAVHWYGDFFSPPEALDKAHNDHPDHFILNTEACTGEEFGPSLGNWNRGEMYASDIINDLNHHVVGWCDWNIALNGQGGPNWAKNFVDSPIIIDASNDRFMRNPMYYSMGHFSRFIRPGAIRIETVVKQGISIPGEAVLAATTMQNGIITMVVLNRHKENATLQVSDGASHFQHTAPGNSIQTIIWRRKNV